MEKGKEWKKYGKALIETLSEKIVNACVRNLNWTHFYSLLRVADEEVRIWYMNDTVGERRYAG